MHIQFIFRPMEDLEGALMTLYQWYSDLFTLDSEARAVFSKLSGEEKGHVALVRYQKKLVSKNLGLFGDVDVDLQEIRRLTMEAHSLTRAANRPSLEEAVAAAVRFEHSAAEWHLRSAMKLANPDMGKLLNALCQGDKGHLEGLLAFARQRGFPTVEVLS